MRISVERSTNCEGMPETEFTALGPTTSSDPELVYILENSETQEIIRIFRVIGWTVQGGGRPCNVQVVQALDRNGRTGILIYGGDGGVRILDDQVARKHGEDERHPRGHGFPILWSDHYDSLSDEVLEALGVRETKEGYLLRRKQ